MGSQNYSDDKVCRSLQSTDCDDKSKRVISKCTSTGPILSSLTALANAVLATPLMKEEQVSDADIPS